MVFLSIRNMCAQKKVIDSTTYYKWPVLEGVPVISNDGKFTSYAITIGSGLNKKNKYVVQSTQSNWKLELFALKSVPEFTADNRICYYINLQDSLCLLNLSTKKTIAIPNIATLEKPLLGVGKWLVYSLKNENKTTVIRNLFSNKEMVITSVISKWISDNGKEIIVQTASKDGDVQLTWMQVENSKSRSIWKGKITGYLNLVTDFNNNQLAFKVDDRILYYKLGMSASVCLMGKSDSSSVDLNKFSRIGDRLFISINKTVHADSVQCTQKGAPEVWSYKDAKLQSIQEKEISQMKAPNFSLAVIRIFDHKFFPLQKHKDEFFLNRQFEDILLSTYTEGEGYYQESWWNSTSSKKWDLIYTKTGKRKTLDFLCKETILEPDLSPDGKFVVYYDTSQNDYFSYDTRSGKKYNLTKGLKNSWMRIESNPLGMLRGIAGWLANDEGVLIYDSHDIWMLDPSNHTPATNVTNGYGIKNNLVFSLALNDPYDVKSKILSKNLELIFSVLNLINKDNGFYKKSLDKSGNPEKLIMENFIYRTNSHNGLNVFDFKPIKSRDAEMYLVRRQSSSEAPNYYCTSNFKSFRKLTTLQSQKDYNWYTSELHSWKSIDGNMLQGVLYKPENFDPYKKYPVIFYYYQKLSDGLNAFLMPDFSHGGIDVPTYVSNGYLVFCPDINYKIGDPMQGTYDAVVSGANYISKLPFVDAKRLGLQGFSFGGVQTNFLVTHTNLFAAACSSSGISDWVSAYGALSGNQKEGYSSSLAGNYENMGQLRMWKSLWANLEGYIKSSAIFSVDQVTTPLLLMHTKNDRICPPANIMEFFLGLRRMGKKSWLLLYPAGTHSISGKEAEDFTIRMRQFFDHYLMDKAAPIWMLDGVPAKDRAFNARTTLDTKGRTPGKGLLTQVQQKEADSIMTRKPILITLK